MEIQQIIEKRRAYRCLEKKSISNTIIQKLMNGITYTPSCYNKQPWRYVFATDENKLIEMRSALSKGNEWAYDASMIIGVFSEKSLDCLVGEREYYLFDTGMATGYLLLLATEMGLVAHPIAGFDEDRAKQILKIPSNMRLITLIIVGYKKSSPCNSLQPWQKEAEEKRPERMKNEVIFFMNEFAQS